MLTTTHTMWCVCVCAPGCHTTAYLPLLVELHDGLEQDRHHSLVKVLSCGQPGQVHSLLLVGGLAVTLAAAAAGLLLVKGGSDS